MEEVSVLRCRPAELIVDELDLDRLLRRGDQGGLSCTRAQASHEALSLIVDADGSGTERGGGGGSRAPIIRKQRQRATVTICDNGPGQLSSRAYRAAHHMAVVVSTTSAAMTMVMWHES